MKPGIGTKVDSDRINEDALRLLAEADGEAAMRQRGLDPARVRRMFREIMQSGRHTTEAIKRLIGD